MNDRYLLPDVIPDRRGYHRRTTLAPCHSTGLRDRCRRRTIYGHNLVFRLSVLFRHLFDNGRPGSAAKGLLIERLRNQIDQARGLQITLWFDGALAAVETPHPQLSVRYSGGTGPDRADREIVAFLREQVPASPSPLFLVTDDIDEARRARKLGAQIVACGEFRRMVV